MKPLQLIIAATLFAPALSGCAKSDDQICASHGYKPGTEGFGNCMMQREQQKMFPERAATSATNQQMLHQQQMNAIQNSTYRPSTTAVRLTDPASLGTEVIRPRQPNLFQSERHRSSFNIRLGLVVAPVPKVPIWKVR